MRRYSVRPLATMPWMTPASAFRDITAALRAFQLEDISFRPYNSKFDLRIQQEGRTADRGRIARDEGIHRSRYRQLRLLPLPGRGLSRQQRLFTDFSYEAIGVPRNDITRHCRGPIATISRPTTRTPSASTWACAARNGRTMH